MSIKDTSKPLPKINPDEVAEAIGSGPPFKVKMSRQVRMFMATMDDGERAEFLDFIEKLSRGEVEGEMMTPEEIERLKVEEGIDLEAAALAAATESEEGEA